MRQFLKYFFASVLGSMVGLCLAFFLGALILISISAGLVSKAKETQVEAKPNSVLELNLDYPIKERTAENPFEEFDFSSFEPKRNLGLTDILKRIGEAKKDDNIKGIYLDVSMLPSGMATVEAIRKELVDFKSSGKFIVAYGEVITQKAYYLASVADEIYLNPVGYLEFRGFRTQLPFLKNMLNRLEIEPQVVYAGKYKSATEPLRYDKMSDPNREQVTSLIHDIYDHFLANISSARDIPTAVLDSIASNLTVREPQDAVNTGLIDGVVYFDEVLSKLKDKVGIEKNDKLQRVAIGKYGKKEDKSAKDYKKDKIAVLYAQGDIVDGEGDEQNIGSATYAKAIRKIREDDDIKAMVFRINSGGGSALASDVILREVKLASQKMPVIVSMGDVAASGGYFIACSADSILAEPNTITGSIGVFGIIPNFQGFFNNKLGITFDGVKTGKYSDLGTVTRPMTPDEKSIIQAAIDTMYRTFKQRVAKGRTLSVEYVDSIGQGRVWTGTQAISNGLVDAIGGLQDAIKIAANKAGIKDFRLTDYPKRKDPFERFMKEFGASAETYFMKKKLGDYYSTWTQVEALKNLKGFQARMPFEVEIY